MLWCPAAGVYWLMVDYPKAPRLVEHGIIRFTVDSVHFRIKAPECMNLRNYDFLKLLNYLSNQESPLQSLNSLQMLEDIAEKEYIRMLSDQAISRDLVNFEKHLIYTRYMLFRRQDPHNTQHIQRAEISRGCREAYAEVMKNATDLLLNQYGVIFIPYTERTGFKGTPYTLARMLALGFIDLEPLRQSDREYARKVSTRT